MISGWLGSGALSSENRPMGGLYQETPRRLGIVRTCQAEVGPTGTGRGVYLETVYVGISHGDWPSYWRKGETGHKTLRTWALTSQMSVGWLECHSQWCFCMLCGWKWPRLGFTRGWLQAPDFLHVSQACLIVVVFKRADPRVWRHRNISSPFWHSLPIPQRCVGQSKSHGHVQNQGTGGTLCHDVEASGIAKPKNGSAEGLWEWGRER